MEPSRTAKWATVLVMALATGATVWGTLTYGDVLLKLAIAYGPPGKLPQFYLWCGVAAACIAVWIVTYFLCALIQRSFNVWFGFALLPLLLLAVGGANFGPHYGPILIEELKFRWFEESDQKAILAVKEDNFGQILVNEDLCRGELEKLGFPEFMFAASLGAPHGLDRAREKIKKAGRIADDCNRRDLARIKKFRRAIAALEVSEKAKRDALAEEFVNGADSAEADRAALQKLEHELIAEYERQLDDLYASKDLWYTDGQQIVFIRKRDLTVFNAHVERANKLISEGKVLEERLRSRDKTQYVVVRKNFGL